MKNNNDRLRVLMREYALPRAEVARRVRVAIQSDGRSRTVDSWLAKPNSSYWRKMPERALLLLETTLQLEGVKYKRKEP